MIVSKAAIGRARYVVEKVVVCRPKQVLRRKSARDSQPSLTLLTVSVSFAVDTIVNSTAEASSVPTSVNGQEGVLNRPLRFVDVGEHRLRSHKAPNTLTC